METAIVGREGELALVAGFLDRLPTGPSALVIVGEAGIGKTTLWLETVRAAKARAFRVLEARPAGSEVKLSYAALADLVGSGFDETRASLPRVQERAMASALLRSETDEPASARTTATALVGVLTALAEQKPLLLAIDDVQWLDSASKEALAFAVRRLPPQLGLLVARRSDPSEELPLGLGRALPPDRVELLVPAPLTLAGLHHLIRANLETSLPRPLLVRLGEASGGNPFFALEIGRVLAQACRRVLRRRAASHAPRSGRARWGARRRPVRGGTTRRADGGGDSAPDGVQSGAGLARGGHRRGAARSGGGRRARSGSVAASASLIRCLPPRSTERHRTSGGGSFTVTSPPWLPIPRSGRITSP